MPGVGMSNAECRMSNVVPGWGRGVLGVSRGSTLIEVMIVVATVAVIAASVGLQYRSLPSQALDDGLRARELLRSELALLRAGQAGAPSAWDGMAFTGVDAQLNLLPNASARVAARPLPDGGPIHVTLTVQWRRRASTPQEMRLSALLPGAGAP
jgi:hypothetical protein